MPEFPIQEARTQDPNAQKDESLTTQNRLCDFCGESIALLYCRADSAKLCLACDREVHSTNPLFTKHTRSQLCDVCDSSPASIFCSTERSVLCQNCDYELHSCLKNSSPVHERRALEGFNGCPSVSQLTTFVGLENFDTKSLLVSDGCEDLGGGFLGGCEETDGFLDFLVWDAPAIVSIDELIVSSDKNHSFQALAVPPLPKDRNWSCGQHKQEILDQLRQLAKSEPNLEFQTDGAVGVGGQTMVQEDHFGVNEMQNGHVDGIQCSGLETSLYPWSNDVDNEAANEIFLSSTLLGSYLEEGAFISDVDSAAGSCLSPSGNQWQGQNANVNDSSALPPQGPGQEFSTVDRDSALSRYREKKRTRRYEKHIRYESRKMLAETRTRVKGRFAKIDNRVRQSWPHQ